MAIAPFQKVVIHAKLTEKLRRLVMTVCDRLVKGVATSLILDAQVAPDLNVKLNKCEITEHGGLKDVSFRIRFYLLTGLGLCVYVISLAEFICLGGPMLQKIRFFLT